MLESPNLIDRELGLGVVNHSSFVGRRKNSRFPLRAVPFVPTIVFAVFPSEYEKNCLRKTLKRHWWQAKEKRKKEKRKEKQAICLVNDAATARKNVRIHRSISYDAMSESVTLLSDSRLNHAMP